MTDDDPETFEHRRRPERTKDTNWKLSGEATMLNPLLRFVAIVEKTKDGHIGYALDYYPEEKSKLYQCRFFGSRIVGDFATPEEANAYLVMWLNSAAKAGSVS